MIPFHHLDPAPLPDDAALIWPWAHNWAQPATERLEWRTSIHTSQASKEQRRALRQEPRLQIGLSHILQGADAATALNLLRGWLGKTWAAPAWWASSQLTASASGTALALSRTTDTLWQVGSTGMVWVSPGSLEPFTVAAVGEGTLTLTASLGATWPAGARVVPLYFATLPDTQAASAVTGEVLRLDVQFDALPGLNPALPEPADGTDWPDALPTDGVSFDPRTHVFGLRNNWTQDMGLSLATGRSFADMGVGRLTSRDMLRRPALSWSASLLLQGDASIAQLRKFLAMRQGQAVGMYALSPLLDMDSLDMVGGEVEVPSLRFNPVPDEIVAGVSYVVGKTRICAPATLTGSVLAISNPITQTLRYPRLVVGARLGTDAILLSHTTQGVAQVTVPITTCDESGILAQFDSLLLLHGEGANGSATYTDSSPHARTLAGANTSSVVVSTAQAFRGSSSLHFIGPANFYAPAPTSAYWASMGTDSNPLTIEVAVQLETGNSGGIICGNPGLTGGAFGWPTWRLDADTSPAITLTYNGHSASISLTGWSQGTGVWHMIAIACKGDTAYEFGVWLDGVWQGSTVFPYPIVPIGSIIDGDLNIGRSGGNAQFLGYMDELRLTNRLILPWGQNYEVSPNPFPS